MRKILVVAPHPDDETLGVGGTLLRHARVGDELHWLIVTAMSVESGFSPDRMKLRTAEIRAVASALGVAATHQLGFAPGSLDVTPMSKLVEAIGEVVRATQPETIYVPFRSDIHTDHAAAFDATVSCTKWFRFPSVRRVLAYETLSETDFNLRPSVGFSPTLFVDVTPFIEQKLRIMALYASEMQAFPFPRSESALRSLARVRGAACGCEAAEAFQLLREIQK